MPITTTLDEFRLLIGDTISGQALFNDPEAEWFLSERAGNVRLAAADACESLAIRYARDYNMSVDGTSLSRAQVSKAYSDRAKELRERVGGLGVIQTTKVDGYSEDLSHRDGAGGVRANTGRVRAGYYSPDLPS